MWEVLARPVRRPPSAPPRPANEAHELGRTLGARERTCQGIVALTGVRLRLAPAFELFPDDAPEISPRSGHDATAAEPDARDHADEPEPHHAPLDFLAVEIALLLVLDVAVLAHALDVGETRMDPVRGTHVAVGAIVQIADVEIDAVVPQPREHAVALRRDARRFRGLLDGLDGNEEVEALDHLVALERGECRR